MMSFVIDGTAKWIARKPDKRVWEPRQQYSDEHKAEGCEYGTRKI